MRSPPSRDDGCKPPATVSSQARLLRDDLPVMAAPYVPPPPVGPQAMMQPLGPGAPFAWLGAGWRDLKAHPGIGLFYGLCFWLMAVTLGAVFRARPEYTLTIASGCLLVGPFLAMGLYEVSRRREQGLTPELGASLTCWDSHIRSMGMLILVMIVLELLWGRASLVVFAVFFNTGMPSTTGVLNAVFNPDNWEFVAVYLVLGGMFAALVFSTAVVSIPMILDRDTDAISAAITSIRVVFSSPGVMLLWGLVITTLIALALLPWGAGLVVIGPLLGHASWHAYRGTVRWQEADASASSTAHG
ncbi:predicted integral membrane protein [Polaromonas sp. CG9_12]|nr:predicted integral membrane protein [Polaromonas sp. CG9_12]